MTRCHCEKQFLPSALVEGAPAEPGTPLIKPADNRRQFDAAVATPRPHLAHADSFAWKCRLQRRSGAATTKKHEEQVFAFPNHTFLHTAGPSDRSFAAAALIAEARRYQRLRNQTATATLPPATPESVQSITSPAVRYRLLHPRAIPYFPLHQNHIARLLLSDIQLLTVPCSESSPDGNFAHVMGELGRLRLW